VAIAILAYQEGSSGEICSFCGLQIVDPTQDFDYTHSLWYDAKQL